MHADETTGPGPRRAGAASRPQVGGWAVLPGQRHPGIRIRVPRAARQVGRRGLRAGWKGTLTTDGYRPYFNSRRPTSPNTAPGARPPKVCRDRQGRRRRRWRLSPRFVRRLTRRMIDDVQGRQGLLTSSTRGSARRRGSSAPPPQPLMRDFYAFCVRSARSRRRDKLDKACATPSGAGPYVMNVLDDGRLEPLDNNIAERGMITS